MSILLNASANPIAVYANVSGNPSVAFPTRPIIINGAGHIKNLFVSANVAPGSGNSVTVTAVLNGVDTTSTAIINGTDLSAADVTHTVVVNDQDILSFRFTLGGTPLTTNVGIQIEFF